LCRLAFTRYLSGRPLEELETVPLIGGFPKELQFMVNYLETLDKDSDLYFITIKVFMTLFNIGRAFYLKPVLKTDTITDPWNGTLPCITDEVHNKICKRLHIKEASVQFKSFHFTTKKGPNGPAMANSPKDLASLPQSTINDIMLIGGDELSFQLKKCFMRTPIKNLSFLQI